jgi:hypothetical protein
MYQIQKAAKPIASMNRNTSAENVFTGSDPRP